MACSSARSADGVTELRFTAPEVAGGAPLADAAASVLLDTTTFSASGMVTNGDVTRDIAIDVMIDVETPDSAVRSCTDQDRI